MDVIRVIPVLLVENGRLVKTRKFRKRTYIGDPINVVNIFNHKQVDELIVLDIGCSKKHQSPNYELIAALAKECFMPFAYGGGIITLEQMFRVFNLGAEKVVLNSLLLNNPAIISEAVNTFGAQSIVVSLDVGQDFFKRRRIYSHVRNRYLHGTIEKYLHLITDLGVGEVMINSVQNDGEMCGYDFNMLNNIATSLDIPVIGCGGAGSVEDIVKLAKETVVSAAAGGSIFVFHGKYRAVLITYPKYEELKFLLGSNADG